MSDGEHPDRTMARIARRQHGYVTRGQLLAAGLSARQIAYRVTTGQLTTVYAGVYAVGHVPPAPIARAAAAVLACGPGAALSHGSALALWGAAAWRRPLEVTARSDRRRSGIRIHRCRNLERRDLTTHWGIRVTSPARTILAMAARLSDLRLARAYNELLRANYLHREDLERLIGRCAASPGIPRLMPLLAIQGGPTRSELEDAFLAFVREQGLPVPQTSVEVGGHEVDAYYPEQRVIVELDSVRFHLDRLAFETDRDRDANALALGVRTIRLTDERLTRTPAREAERLRRILGC